MPPPDRPGSEGVAAAAVNRPVSSAWATSAAEAAPSAPPAPAGMGADRLGLGPRAAEPAELAQDLVQRLPPDELHDVVGRPSCSPTPKTGTMLVWCSSAAARASRRNRSREPGVEPRVARQDLQRHVPAQRGLLGLVDHAHAAAADLAEDPVVADLADRRAVGRLAVGERAGGVAGPGQRAEPLHLDHGREDERGSRRPARGSGRRTRPAPAARPCGSALEERLGQRRDAAAGRGGDASGMIRVLPGRRAWRRGSVGVA